MSDQQYGSGDDFDLNELLSKPDYEKRGKSFMIETPWRLNNELCVRDGELIDDSFSIIMDWNNDPVDEADIDAFIDEIEPLADSDGFVPVSQVERARSGNDEVDNELGWNVKEMNKERRESEVFSAHNFQVNGIIKLEEDGTVDVLSYNWDKVRYALEEICKDGLSAGGLLENKVSAMAWRRGTDTVCV